MNGIALAVANVIFFCSFFCYGLWLQLHVDRKIKARGNLVMAIGYGFQVIVFVIIHKPVAAGIHAAFFAWFLYQWWNGGGGDGLRRMTKKLRSWGSRLAPTAA